MTHSSLQSPPHTYSPLVISIYAIVVNYTSSGNSEVDTYPVWSFLLIGSLVSKEEHARQLRAVPAYGFPDKLTCHHKWKFLLFTWVLAQSQSITYSLINLYEERMLIRKWVAGGYPVSCAMTERSVGNVLPGKKLETEGKNLLAVWILLYTKLLLL